MSNYDELIEEVRAKAEAFRSSAKEYIPKMYEALRRENPDISPEDARHRIKIVLEYGLNGQYQMLFLMRLRIKKSKKLAD